MSKSIKILFLFIVFFICVLLFFTFRSNKVTDLDSAFISPPVSQELTKRNWKDLVFKEVGNSEDFIYSHHMRFDNKDQIYIADNDLKLIKKFDIEGNLIDVLGKGEGRGPEEFLIIVDLFVDNQNNIWALDDRNNRATIFREDSLKVDILDFSKVFNRVIPINRNEYWFQERFNNLIKIYNSNDQQIGQTEKIVSDPELWSFVLESFAALAPNNDVILSQYHTNLFIKYSKNGDVVYFRKPIEFSGFPKIDPYYANEVGTINTVDFSSWKQITKNPQIVGNTIQFHINKKEIGSEDWDKFFVDVYDLKNGNYLYSYDLPERLQSLAISTGHLAGISEEQGNLKVWKIN